MHDLWHDNMTQLHVNTHSSDSMKSIRESYCGTMEKSTKLGHVAHGVADEASTSTSAAPFTPSQPYWHSASGKLDLRSTSEVTRLQCRGFQMTRELIYKQG